MRVAWAARLKAPPSGLSLAREAGLLLVRDLAGQLSLYDAAGRPVVQRGVQGASASCASEDGQAFACATSRNQLLLLRDELAPGWERGLPARATALALDALGRRLAVADEQGGLAVFDGVGLEEWRATTPRPLVHLAWVPETGHLFGSADFGLVCLFGPSGECLWRDGLLSHVGGVSASGDGKRLLVACYSGGLSRYAIDQAKPQPVGKDAAARQVAQSYAGDVVLTVGLEGTDLARRDAEGATLQRHSFQAPALGVALGALGDWAAALLAGGELLRLEW